MKIDFTVNCDNPAVVFAISDALKAAGFKVNGCGILLATGAADLDCTPPIDFIDSTPAPLLGFVDGSGTPPIAAE